jgi:hypothetical protein
LSTRVLTNTRLAVACQELARQQLQLPATATLDLSGLRAALTSVQRIDLPAISQLVSSAPVRMTLGALAPTAFGTVSQLLISQRPGADAETAAASAREALGSALSTASAAIGAATRDITAEAFTEAGRELGYTISICRGDVATGIELRRDHELVLMRVDDDGVVESDHAGLVGSACGDRQRELEEAAARRGVVITRRDEQRHSSARGGELIRAAAGRRDPSLARAVALSARPAVPSGARRSVSPEPEQRQPARRTR